MLAAIWMDLVEALRRIHTRQGYDITLHTVTTDPAVLVSWPPLHTPAIVVMLSEERTAHEVEAFGETLGALYVFALHVRIDDHSLEDQRRVDQYCRLRAAVWQALQTLPPARVSEWRWWGGEGPQHDQGMMTATWYLGIRARA